MGSFSRSSPFFALLFSFALASPASALPLYLTMPDAPDITSALITVTYDAAIDSLEAFGTAIRFDDGLGQQLIRDGTFNLTATIDDGGALSPGGSLRIDGSVGGPGPTPPPTLLSGNLTAFGFPDSGGDPLEFLFEVTGGDLAGHYGGTGGVILSLLSGGFDGTTFDADFGTSGANAVADTSVPEPGTLPLVLLGSVGLAAAARRRRRASNLRWSMRSPGAL